MDNKDNKVKFVSLIPLTLYQDTETDGHYASLSWGIRMGYPRITVYTDNTKDRSDDFTFDKLITAPMNAIVVNSFIALFRKVIGSEKEQEFSIKCFNVKYVDDKKTDDIILQATIHVGRNKEGVIYMSARSEGKSEVDFKLLNNSKWHKFAGKDGVVVTDERELSTLHATAYCDRLKTLMDKFLIDQEAVSYKERKTPAPVTDGISKAFD